jgi:hypothetical protein
MSARDPERSELPGSAQILRWEPPRWDGFLGNTRLKHVLRSVAMNSRSSTEIPSFAEQMYRTQRII